MPILFPDTPPKKRPKAAHFFPTPTKEDPPPSPPLEEAALSVIQWLADNAAYEAESEVIDLTIEGESEENPDSEEDESGQTEAIVAPLVQDLALEAASNSSEAIVAPIVEHLALDEVPRRATSAAR